MNGRGGYGSSQSGGSTGGYSSNTGSQSGGYSSSGSSFPASGGGYSSNTAYQQTGSAHVHRDGLFGNRQYHTSTITYHSPTPNGPGCCNIL